MPALYPLYSSSKGNCTYIGGADSGILIDCGVTCKKAEEALALHGIPVTAVKAVCITHIHDDHIKGLKMLTKKLPLTVVAQRVTLELLTYENKVSPYSTFEVLEEGQSLDVCGYEIKPFVTSHDTPVSCGYTVTAPDGRRASVCTDLGVVTDNVLKALLGSDTALIEANYDETMLKNGYYPEYLKARISSDHGHLSNEAGGELAKKLVEGGTRRIILGHLSEHNNMPRLAENTVLHSLRDYVRGDDYELFVATPDFSGLAVEI